MSSLQFFWLAAVLFPAYGKNDFNINPAIETNDEGASQRTMFPESHPWSRMFESSVAEMTRKYLFGPKQSKTGSTCEADSMEYLMNLHKIFTSLKMDTTPPWVVQLIDTSGKPSDGILEGNMKWLGSFTECLKVKVRKMNATDVRFTGQYCTANVNFHATNLTTSILRELGIFQGSPKKFAFSVGVCWPSSCTAQEIADQLNSILRSKQTVVNIPQSNCIVDKPDEFDGLAIAAIILFSIFGFLLITATSYDLSKTDESQSGLAGVALRLLLAFSVYRNGKKILNTKQDKGAIRCIHGLRFFSIAWVVLGHTYVNGLLEGPFGNVLAVKDAVHNIVFNIVLNSTFSVDTFLVISGFLVTYSFLMEMKRTDGKFGLRNLFDFYFHRYWRLTPVYSMAILFVAGIYTHISSGPLWHMDTQFEQDNCRKYWWRNILYIQNLFPIEDMCHDVSWYLGIDMQFYTISLVILYPLYKMKNLGLAFIGIFFAATTIITGLIIHINDLPSILYTNLGGNYGESSQEQQKYMDMVYITPWCRMGPYIVGMFCGYVVHKTDPERRQNLSFIVIGWSLSTIVGLALVFGNYHYYIGDWVMSNFQDSVYGALSRSVWGIVVSWIIYACATGRGGWVNTFLSWNALIPASRLTYCAYLIHIYVLIAFYSSQKASFHFSHFFMILVFFGTLTISMGLAFVSSLAFEAPMMEMEKMFRQKINNRSEASVTQPQSSGCPNETDVDISKQASIPATLVEIAENGE